MGMYCKKCRYDLSHCVSSACPECGRGFAPENARSYAKRERRRRFHPVRFSVLLLMMLGMFCWVIIWPQFRTYGQHAPYSNATSQLHTIRSQMDLYANQHGDQFPTLTQLQHGWSVLIVETHGDDGAVCGPYLAKTPVNPLTGSSTVTAPGQATADDGWEYDETTGQLRYVIPTKAKFDELGADLLDAVVPSHP